MTVLAVSFLSITMHFAQNLTYTIEVRYSRSAIKNDTISTVAAGTAPHGAGMFLQENDRHMF